MAPRLSPQIQRDQREGKAAESTHSTSQPFTAALIDRRNPTTVLFFVPPLTSMLLTLPTGPSCCWANLQRFCLLNSDTSFTTLAPFILPNSSPKNLTGGQTHSTWVMTGAPWLSVWIFTLSSKEGHAYKSMPTLPSSGSGFGRAGRGERKTASE